MALDKNKIIAEATKLVQKGAFDKAIKTYERILAEDAKDVRILLKVGELHQKKGDDHAAAEAFTRVAETYAEQGFFLKSVAVYKQIVKLDPDDVRVNERLAALYQQLGLLSDAMGQMQFMATAHERAGDVARLTDVLKRMVELDPENIASSIKLGELYVRAQQPSLAHECFKRAADHLKKHNRADEYLKIAERLASLSPDDLVLTRELAHLYLNKRDTKRALAKLQLCFKANPKDLETLTLLAQAFHDLGQNTKTVSVYKELAHVYEELGKNQEARSTWRKVLEVAPDDEDAAAVLGGGPAPAAPQPAPPRYTPAAAPGGPPTNAAASRPIVPPAPPQSGPPLSLDAIPKLLTETDVYVKYGLHDKALDHLRKVLLADPDCAPAHEKSRDIHLAAGRNAEAATSAARAVRAHAQKGALDRAREALARLRQIDAVHPELLELSSIASGRPDDGGGAAAAELLTPAGDALPDELALAAAGDESEEVVEDEQPETSPEVLEPEPEFDVPAGDDSLAEDAARHSADSEEVLDEPEPEPPPRPAARPPPGPPPGARAPAPGRPPGAGGPAARATPPRPPTPPPAASAPAPTPAAPAAPSRLAFGGPTRAPAVADLTDELEEADFFLQQGLRDEARESLEGLLARHPGHPELQKRLAALGGPPAAGAPARSPVRAVTPPPAGPNAGRAGLAAPPESPRHVSAGGDDSFDIARELADELGGQSEALPSEDDFQYSVEDVFNQFKKGVAETVRPEDSATHYDLGIAYKEMGLVDDAVHEFELAMRDRKREVDCLSMIGLCRTAQGKHREAIQVFRRALGSDYLNRDAAKAIHFELGCAYQAAGDTEVALFVLHKVARVDPAYRDVDGRLRELGGGPGHPPADEPRAARSVANRTTVPAPRPATTPAGGTPSVGGSKKNIGYL